MGARWEKVDLEDIQVGDKIRVRFTEWDGSPQDDKFTVQVIDVNGLHDPDGCVYSWAFLTKKTTKLRRRVRLRWRMHEDVPAWLVPGVQVRITKCGGNPCHLDQVGTFSKRDSHGWGWVDGVEWGPCTYAGALELVDTEPAKPAPVTDEPVSRRVYDVWVARAGIAEKSIEDALRVHVSHTHDMYEDCATHTSGACAMARILRGES